MSELLAAGRRVFSDLKNLCVSNKSNGGIGTFYCSKHELVFVFKIGSGPHTNSFGTTRGAELAMHPTVKPVELVADAIRDCSKRGDIVLDLIGGLGTTIIAAERVGRCARLREYDLAYCDTIVRRWAIFTGKYATPVRRASASRMPKRGGRPAERKWIGWHER